MANGKPIVLTKKQSSLVYLLQNPAYRRYLIDGSARSGKTVAILCFLLAEMELHPGIRIVCLRQHRVHARTTLYEGSLKALVGQHPSFTFQDTTMELTHKNGSVLRVDGLDDEARVDKILGDEFAHCFCNETSQMRWPAIKVAMSRLAQNIEGLEKRCLIMDCNPKSLNHWLYRWAILHLDPDTGKPIIDPQIFARMSFTTGDNPFLPKDAIESLQALTGTERKRLYEGIWANAENLAYPEFTIEKNVKEMNTATAQSWLVGVDSGYNDPVVMTLAAIFLDKDVGKRLHIKEIFYQAGSMMSTSIASVAERWRSLDPCFVVDPSAGAALIELSAKGFRTEKADNKLKEGIRNMRDCINTGRLTIEPSVSHGLVDEISGYEIDPGTELPKGDTADHILDATRYMCMKFSNVLGKRSIPNLFILADEEQGVSAENDWRKI